MLLEAMVMAEGAIAWHEILVMRVDVVGQLLAARGRLARRTQASGPQERVNPDGTRSTRITSFEQLKGVLGGR